MSGKGGSSAVQSCTLAKGEALITVFRSDVPKTIPGATVTLKGPTPGTRTTDSAGWAEFKGLTPGSYTFSVKLPQDHYVTLPFGDGLSVAARDVALGNVRAHPTGTLEVRVIDEVTSAVLARSTIDTTEAPQSLTWSGSAGTHVFEKVLPGKYTVTARGDDKLYDLIDITKLGTATVPEGGKATATIPLPPKTWIEVVVHDKVENVDVARVTVKLKPAGGLPVTATTDGKTPLRFPLLKRPATCSIVELDSADDILFEVVDVQSA